MIDGNTYALNKHLEEQDRRDDNWELFLKTYNIEELQRALDYARVGAKDFGGYDFSEELEEELV